MKVQKKKILQIKKIAFLKDFLYQETFLSNLKFDCALTREI